MRIESPHRFFSASHKSKAQRVTKASGNKKQPGITPSRFLTRRFTSPGF
jgi:hypothetical protein